MQGRREEETGAYCVVREDFRRPSTQQMDFFSSLLVSRRSLAVVPVGELGVDMITVLFTTRRPVIMLILSS